MTRRKMLAAVAAGSGTAAGARTQKNFVTCAAEFGVAYSAWVEAINRNLKPGCIDMSILEAWEPLPGLFDDLDKQFRRYILGLRKLHRQ